MADPAHDHVPAQQEREHPATPYGHGHAHHGRQHPTTHPHPTAANPVKTEPPSAGEIAFLDAAGVHVPAAHGRGHAAAHHPASSTTALPSAHERAFADAAGHPAATTSRAGAAQSPGETAFLAGAQTGMGEIHAKEERSEALRPDIARDIHTVGDIASVFPPAGMGLHALATAVRLGEDIAHDKSPWKHLAIGAVKTGASAFGPIGTTARAAIGGGVGNGIAIANGDGCKLLQDMGIGPSDPCVDYTAPLQNAVIGRFKKIVGMVPAETVPGDSGQPDRPPNATPAGPEPAIQPRRDH